MPDGLCWLADGHHRTSVALWTETLEDVEGTFRVPIRIIDNYSEMPLVDALTRLVQAHQLYLSPPALKHFNALLSSDMTPDLRELALTHFIEAEIPSQFTQLSDDPLRNAVGNVLHSLLKDIPTEAFIEFRVQEFLAQKLGINPGGSTGKFTQKCALDGLGQPCTQLTPKAMKRVAQIIYDHPSISEMLLQSIPIDQDCPIHSADSKRCRELFLERIKHESFYHY
jgi:hypothetical protein